MNSYALLNNPVLRGPLEPSQFRSGKFVRALRSSGLIGSMGRTGTFADNAAMESSLPWCRTTCST
jgi:hypothetical protein